MARLRKDLPFVERFEFVRNQIERYLEEQGKTLYEDDPPLTKFEDLPFDHRIVCMAELEAIWFVANQSLHKAIRKNRNVRGPFPPEPYKEIGIYELLIYNNEQTLGLLNKMIKLLERIPKKYLFFMDTDTKGMNEVQLLNAYEAWHLKHEGGEDKTTTPEQMTNEKSNYRKFLKNRNM